jgi:hypothetical protein
LGVDLRAETKMSVFSSFCAFSSAWRQNDASLSSAIFWTVASFSGFETSRFPLTPMTAHSAVISARSLGAPSETEALTVDLAL